MMVRLIFVGLGLATASYGQAQTADPPKSNQQEKQMNSGLIAVEFSGSKKSLERLADAAVKLGWRVDSHADKSLRILPPPNYDPAQFGLLLQRIEQLGISDIGLKLIGPNGPVGPEG